MTRSARARIIITATVAATAAVVVLLAYPPGASSAETRSVALGGGAAKESCTPCHPSIGTSRNANIIFDHAAHLLVECAACHPTPAHEGGVTDVPTMDSCFACHGLVHGPTGELASAECVDCHPATFELRPVSHVEDWAATPHADASAGGVNRCMMCHDAPVDCDECHATEAPDVGSMPVVYLSTLPDPSPGQTVSVDLAGPVEMGQCVYCH